MRRKRGTSSIASRRSSRSAYSTPPPASASPCAAKRSAWSRARPKLDDRAVQPEWETDGSALLLEIAEPGEYRLELTLRPTVQPGNRASGFDLAIPRVPTARLEFTVPAGGPRVEFPSALGAVRWEEVAVALDRRIGPQRSPRRQLADAAPAGARPPSTSSNCSG